MAEPIQGPSRQELIAAYKAVLRAYIDQRPSGMRLRLANVLGTHKSFISQITNPADPTPLPPKHVDAIFEVCHLSSRERETFLSAYLVAHPRAAVGAREAGGASPHRTLHVDVPVLADPAKQRALEELVREFARRVAELVKGEGGS